MSLITPEYVQENFEAWQNFCTVEGSAFTPEEILENKIALAEAEFSEYLTVTAETITDPQLRHLLNLVKKHLFDIKHGDTEFEHPPQIVKDYEASIAWLQKYRTRIAGIDGDASISLTAKRKRFGQWFNQTDCAAMINSNDE